MALKIGIIGNGGISNAHMDGYKALGDRVEVVDGLSEGDSVIVG